MTALESHEVVVDGVRIGWDDRPGTGVPLVLLHGFLGSGAAMATLVDALDACRRVADGSDPVAGAGTPRRIVTLDVVGHGRSDASADVDAYAIDRVVAQISAVIDLVSDRESDAVGGAGVGAGVVDLFGYSMGGRLALATALAHPDRIRRLVLLGATAGIDDSDERAARRASDEELATFAESAGIEAFVARWEELPIFATQNRLPAEVRERIRLGRTAQRVVGVANSLRGTGTGSMPPMWDRLGEFNAPTLVLAGVLDSKYVELGTRLAAALPDGRFAAIADAGHAAHSERPDAVAALVAPFLAPPPNDPAR